tara:strand:+ start:977 stop:1753 length:777 start_codon:yes stop_codon:yes gene_type:complete
MNEYNNFQQNLAQKGWHKIPNAYTKDYIDSCKEKVKSIYSTYEEIQEKGGVLDKTRNSLHHICAFYPELVDYAFTLEVCSFLDNYFQGKFILNSFGSTKLNPNGTTYTQKMHRDARDINSSKDMLNLIILLDDSTSENGATKMLEGSHLKDHTPTREYFDKNAINISGSAGDLIIFNPYAWHATGVNTSSNSRTIITPMVSRPFIKSGLDYVRTLGKDYFESCPEKLKQLFGYNARIPASLEEFYVPKHKRMYQNDQR